MTTSPPRARPRAVPTAPEQPYPLAADYESPVSIDETEAEPIPLESDDVPTMKELGDAIGAVSSHLQVVHREASLARVAATDAAAEAKAARSGVAELRKLVIGDHAPRITEAEQAVREVEKRVPITIPPIARKGAAYGAVAAVYPLLEWLIPIAQKWLETR